MEFFVKKTHDLSDLEKKQLNALFIEVFEKARKQETMFNQYTNNPLGFSYHSLFVADGVIRGAATYVPSHFNYCGRTITVATGIDVMIAQEHRNFYEFRKIIKNVFKALKDDGVAMIYGFPNDNSHPVYKTAGLMSDIGMLHIYCLPYRIGGIKRRLKLFNWLSMAVCRARVLRARLFSSKEVAKFLIEKSADYNDTRYKRLDGEYSQAALNENCTLYYKITLHDGVRTAFIIDLSEKSPRHFAEACHLLLSKESGNFDLILYPGYLPFGCNGLFKLPRKMEPKNFHFAAQILDNESVDPAVVFDINNWDTNLSLYDLI